jgi:hypothetical protein
MLPGVNEKQLWRDWFHYALLAFIYTYAFSIGSGRMKRGGAGSFRVSEAGRAEHGGGFAVREWRMGGVKSGGGADCAFRFSSFQIELNRSPCSVQFVQRKMNKSNPSVVSMARILLIPPLIFFTSFLLTFSRPLLSCVHVRLQYRSNTGAAGEWRKQHTH